MEEKNEIELLDVVAYLINYIKKKYLLILLILALPVASILTYYSTRDDYYSCSTVLTTNGTEFTTVEQISLPLVRSIQYNQDQLSAAMLNVPVDLVKKIETLNVIEVEPHPAERKAGCTFQVELISSDKGVFSEFDAPLLKYFNDNDFIRHTTAIKLDILTELKEETSKQIGRLDSVQRIIPEAIKGYETNKLFWNDLNLGTLYQEMLQLKVAETETLEKIRLIDEFKTLQPFKIVEPTKGLIFYTGIGVLIGILINVVILIIAVFNDLLKRRKAAMA